MGLHLEYDLTPAMAATGSMAAASPLILSK